MKATTEFISELTKEMQNQLNRFMIDDSSKPCIAHKIDGCDSITINEWFGIYANNNLTQRRAMWDLFNKANGNHNSFRFSNWMYNILGGNDSHIETAIKTAIKQLK